MRFSSIGGTQTFYGCTCGRWHATWTAAARCRLSHESGRSSRAL